MDDFLPADDDHPFPETLSLGGIREPYTGPKGHPEAVQRLKWLVKHRPALRPYLRRLWLGGRQRVRAVRTRMTRVLRVVGGSDDPDPDPVRSPVTLVLARPEWRAIHD